MYENNIGYKIKTRKLNKKKGAVLVTLQSSDK